MSVNVLPCPVISIGNLEVGGTGKTPMTIYLARLIREWGHRPAVISRGYKGAGSRNGAVVSDGNRIFLDAEEAGDEPYLMAVSLDGVPVVIGSDRFSAGRLAIDRFRPDVLLLDDGFQHFRLHRDLDVVLLDAKHPFGNGYLLPRGRLREPVGALSRSHAVVLTRSGEKEPAYHRALGGALSPRPLFRTRHRVQVRRMVPAGASFNPISHRHSSHPLFANNRLEGKEIFVFSGLARNKAFHNSLSTLGCIVIGSLDFEDHHRYHCKDIHRIVEAARQSSCRYLVTTEKDMVKMPEGTRLPMELVVVGVTIDFNQEKERWHRFVYDRLGAIFQKKRHETKV
jgi:tetraacyldisaccharide 4'-kinase